MAKMRTLIPHTANQKAMVPGDEYEADESSAQVAEALGLSERAQASTQVPAVRTKRQYRRRDMRAES